MRGLTYAMICMAICSGVTGVDPEVNPYAGGKAAATDGAVNLPCTCFERRCENCDCSGALLVNLRNGSVSGSLSGVTVQEFGSPGKHECSAPAILTAAFERPFISKYCRNLLRIDMVFGPDRGGWMFNFGDSSIINGYAGDAGTQSNDAEIDALNGNVRAWASDKCGSGQFADYPGAVATTSWATIWIGNNFYKIASNGLSDERCNPCFFALDGQADPGPLNPGPNQDVYLAFHIVVSNLFRNGWGICQAKITWQCPM